MKLVIKGVGAAADGEYDLPDESSLTFADYRLIKRESGVRAGELPEAFGAGDSDLIVALALIALKRAGKDVPPDVLWESDIAKIDVLVEESDELPPDLAPDSSINGDGRGASSSPSSSVPGDTPPEPVTQ